MKTYHARPALRTDGAALLPVSLPRSLDAQVVKARYGAERHEIEARYAEWEIIGEPELRRPQEGKFNPWRAC